MNVKTLKTALCLLAIISYSLYLTGCFVYFPITARPNPGFIVDDTSTAALFTKQAYSSQDDEKVLDCKRLSNGDTWLLSTHGRVVHFSNHQKEKYFSYNLQLRRGMQNIITEKGILYIDYQQQWSKVFPRIGLRELSSSNKIYELKRETTTPFLPGMDTRPIITDKTIYVHLRRLGVMAIKGNKIKWSTTMNHRQMPMNIEYPMAAFILHKKRLYLVTGVPYTGGAHGINSFSGQTIIIDATSGKLIGTIDYDGPSEEACISEDGVLLRIGCGYSPTVHRGSRLHAYDIETRRKLWSSNSFCHSLHNFDDKILHSTTNKIVCRRARTGERIWEDISASPFSTTYNSVHPSKDGRIYMIVTNHIGRFMQSIDIKTGKTLWQTRLRTQLTHILSEDETHLYCLGEFSHRDENELPQIAEISKTNGDVIDLW